MARLIIDGMTLEQAKLLASYYSSFGEQSADDWMMEHDVHAPFVQYNHLGGWKNIDEETETVTIYTK